MTDSSECAHELGGHGFPPPPSSAPPPLPLRLHHQLLERDLRLPSGPPPRTPITQGVPPPPMNESARQAQLPIKMPPEDWRERIKAPPTGLSPQLVDPLRFVMPPKREPPALPPSIARSITQYFAIGDSEAPAGGTSSSAGGAVATVVGGTSSSAEGAVATGGTSTSAGGAVATVLGGTASCAGGAVVGGDGSNAPRCLMPASYIPASPPPVAGPSSLSTSQPAPAESSPPTAVAVHSKPPPPAASSALQPRPTITMWPPNFKQPPKAPPAALIPAVVQDLGPPPHRPVSVPQMETAISAIHALTSKVDAVAGRVDAVVRKLEQIQEKLEDLIDERAEGERG